MGTVRDKNQSLFGPEPTALESLLAALAPASVLLVTLERAGDLAEWRGDPAVVRALGAVSVGTEGLISAALGGLLGLVPLGGRLARVGWAGAVGAALAAAVLYAIIRRLLRSRAASPNLAALLALAASLMATLTPAWQSESTLAGGASVAAALALLPLCVPLGERDVRSWVLGGLLVAVAAAESHAAGTLALVSLGVRQAARHALPSRASMTGLVLAAAAATAICAIPRFVRPELGWLQLGNDLSSSMLAVAPTRAAADTVFGSWISELGILAVVLGLAGALWGMLKHGTREATASLLVFAVADWLVRSEGTGSLVADPLAVVRLLSLAALSASGALAVQTGARALLRAKIPLTQPAAVLLVVFQLSVALVTLEASAARAGARRASAAEVWTDEALGELPQGALLLVRSEPVVWRLFASRLAQGQRPDLVIVPVPLLARGSVAVRLLELEPELSPLIREISVNGMASEYALSTLADARPLFVELDPSWHGRLLDHLEPNPMWLGFAPHALGRSDRVAALREGRAAFRRVLAAARGSARADDATLAMLGHRAREQAVALAAIGDRSSMRRVVGDLRVIDPEHPFLAELEARLLADQRGRIDVKGLLK